MRLCMSLATVAASLVGYAIDGYDRFDITYGFVFAMWLTWLMDYKRV